MPGKPMTPKPSLTPEAVPNAVVPTDDAEPEAHKHEQGPLNAERNKHAEQQLKTQQNAQNDRNIFPKGLAQEHTKGHS